MPPGGVLGVGLDLVEVGRVERVVVRWGDAFLKRVFTAHEIETCGSGRSRYRRLAARLCAKEAVLKALGQALDQGRPRLGWRDVEIVRTAGGRPEVALHGAARELAARLGTTGVLVTMTHVGDLAAAEAICLGKERDRRSPRR